MPTDVVLLWRVFFVVGLSFVEGKGSLFASVRSGKGSWLSRDLYTRSDRSTSYSKRSHRSGKTRSRNNGSNGNSRSSGSRDIISRSNSRAAAAAAAQTASMTSCLGK